MALLYHHPFCPHSRFVRLALAEAATAAELVEERPWERREEFLILNPMGTTPVLVEPALPPVVGPGPIAEHLDETRGPSLGERRLLPGDLVSRIEARRLALWFNEKFFAEVSQPLVTERIFRRYLPRGSGGGSPDTAAMRAARTNIRYHLAYIGWLMGQRDWLAGRHLSYADLAAAAHLSVADYLGDVPWSENEAAKLWYARVKSRPSFRPLLGERDMSVPAAPSYADLDF